ncbi:DNA-directed RNA polymerases I and III subunit [Phytophthora cinnamomi]|uniref:DNA-directed RNA polymerases I and III subunit n=1 Tax=Phytophthora cinnamomi TaxID=4785 RepID=UPI003559DF66|nr:DNA-directed RNA polymerases I and III subunit [Phytophthora cinnamomi]
MLSTSFTDAIEEAAVLSSPAMQRAIGKSAANYLHHSSSNSSGAVKSEPRADDHAMMAAAPPYELDRDMMGMLANNWNLNAAPPRAPTANWGFEPTPYDSEALMTSASNQPAPLAGSMMMTPPTSADMTHMMGLAGSEPSFASGGVMTNNNTGNNAQQSMSRSAATSLGPDPFSAMDNFVMPYQDCATLPVSDYPLYDDGGIYKPAFDSAGTGPGLNQFTPAGSHVVNNHLSESSVPYFGNNGPMMAAFQQGANAGPLFNEVAQPPAAAMAAINGGFAMPDLSLQEDDDSDWNGSSSGFSTVSSSPVANNALPTLSSSTPTNGTLMPAESTAKISAANKDGAKKPKRIRRLCSIAGCGKRARSQDLCIAHGGGRRCMVEGCEKSSQGGNMCIKHGGGKRCKHPGCDKAAQTNSLCKAHGGGPRCQFPGCTKSSQGGGFCRAHGGGKRCAAEGCNKGTQRGDFCALHGGSRFCEVPGCMRNDRGGGFCAHHGGGKRCSIANCNRSCRRNGLCSTHLRLLGQEAGGKVSTVASPAISACMTTTTEVTSV